MDDRNSLLQGDNAQTSIHSLTMKVAPSMQASEQLAEEESHWLDPEERRVARRLSNTMEEQLARELLAKQTSSLEGSSLQLASSASRSR